jgi:RHS repeat-associated protein
MQMPGRNGSTGDYRYGYQGSEKDGEISGEGNSYTTSFRRLDPRLGRWLSIDPLPDPSASPYNSMDNSPIIYSDKLGLYTEKRANRVQKRQARRGHDVGKVYNSGGGKRDWGFHVSAMSDDHSGIHAASMFSGRNFTKSESNLTRFSELTYIVLPDSEMRDPSRAGPSLIFAALNREWYIRQVAKLEGKYTGRNGVVDYRKGIAGRTKLKDFARRRLMSIPAGRLLDYAVKNKPRLKSGSTPRFFRANPAVTNSLRLGGVLGVVSVILDWHGVIQGTVDPEKAALNTACLALMTYGGPIGFTIGLMYMVGEDASSFGVAGMMDKLESKIEEAGGICIPCLDEDDGGLLQILDNDYDDF